MKKNIRLNLETHLNSHILSHYVPKNKRKHDNTFCRRNNISQEHLIATSKVSSPHLMLQFSNKTYHRRYNKYYIVCEPT